MKEEVYQTYPDSLPLSLLSKKSAASSKAAMDIFETIFRWKLSLLELSAKLSEAAAPLSNYFRNRANKSSVTIYLAPCDYYFPCKMKDKLPWKATNISFSKPQTKLLQPTVTSLRGAREPTERGKRSRKAADVWRHFSANIANIKRDNNLSK